MMVSNQKWVLGFHGCDASTAQKVLHSHRHLITSQNDYDWLGHGVYFWEDDPARAMEWAVKREFEEPTVVGAIIDLGKCLDLTIIENLDLVRKAYDVYYKTFKDSDTLDLLPENSPGFTGDSDLVKRHLDCSVINFLHQIREKSGADPFDTVRSPFSEGRPLFEGAKIVERTHTQICVRNKKTVLGYFKPLFKF
jgi:hypothetical protein